MLADIRSSPLTPIYGPDRKCSGRERFFFVFRTPDVTRPREARRNGPTPFGLRRGIKARGRERSDERLSPISTAWTTFFQAHEAASEEAREARRRLLQHYGGP